MFALSQVGEMCDIMLNSASSTVNIEQGLAEASGWPGWEEIKESRHIYHCSHHAL